MSTPNKSMHQGMLPRKKPVKYTVQGRDRGAVHVNRSVSQALIKEINEELKYHGHRLKWDSRISRALMCNECSWGVLIPPVEKSSQCAPLPPPDIGAGVKSPL